MAEGNIIKRIIKLILDRESAQKAQADIQGSLEGAASKVESTWKSVAARIATYLGVAFLAKKMVDFARAAVDSAAESEAAWRNLAGTIDGAGGSFTKLESQLRATADAFQDATIHDDDAFAKGLTRLVSLTGDVNASMTNMGLVANVAAQFFKGDLEPATDLVAKAMNGNVAALQRMGIQAKTAQEALDILSSRSMGAAEREAGTFSGQLAQLSNLWDDFKKAVGNAIIAGGSASNVFDVLRRAIEQMTTWVENNQEAIANWVTRGLKFAIDAADVFIRAVDGMARVLAGGFLTSLGLAAQGLAKLIEGTTLLQDIKIGTMEKVGETASKLLGLGDKEDLENLKAGSLLLHNRAKALDEWAESVRAAGTEQVQKGIQVLSTPLFSSKDFETPNRPRPKTPGESNKPQLAAGTLSPEEENVRKAIEEFDKAGKRIIALKGALGDAFDDVGANIDRNQKLLEAFAENGIAPASKGFATLGEDLRALKEQADLSAVMKDLAKALGTDAVMAILSQANALDILKQKQSEVGKALQTLSSQTSPEAAAEFQRLSDQFIALGNAIKEQEIVETLHALDKELSDGLFFAALDGASALDKLKIEQDALRKAMQALRTQGIDPTDARLQHLEERYRAVTGAIEEQTEAMKVQAAVADFLAEAIGVAMEGGISEAAAAKAKQNKLEAIEYGVRALAFALFGDAAHAAASLKVAAGHAALAIAWGALAAATHKSGGSSAQVSAASSFASGGGTSGGEDLTTARDTSRRSAGASTTPSPEVSIYLVGPGFHALNPAVQRVVWGAQQQAQERFGPNVRVRNTGEQG